MKELYGLLWVITAICYDCQGFFYNLTIIVAFCPSTGTKIHIATLFEQHDIYNVSYSPQFKISKTTSSYYTALTLK